MKNNKKTKFLDSQYNRAAVIALELAGLITIVILVCAVLRGDILSTSQEPTMYVLQNQQTEGTSYVYGTVYNTNPGNFSDKVSVPASSVTIANNAGITTGAVGTQNGLPQTQSSPMADASTWSTAQILSKASEAINKTKGYRNNLNVHHKEGFNATVTECSGGSIVQSVANMMVGWVVAPVDETLNYSNGVAVNSEGETVPILLPKRGSFTLGQSGVSSASARTSGNEYIINIGIVKESVGMTQIPANNAAAIGYLDVSSFDLSFLTVDSADITYKGSSIELHINSEGYVTYAVYRIPLIIKGSGHSGSISGSVTFEGEQSEQWTLNY